MRQDLAALTVLGPRGLPFGPGSGYRQVLRLLSISRPAGRPPAIAARGTGENKAERLCSQRT